MDEEQIFHVSHPENLVPRATNRSRGHKSIVRTRQHFVADLEGRFGSGPVNEAKVEATPAKPQMVELPPRLYSMLTHIL